MFALSSSAGNGHVRNRYGYQGQERENTFALNLNEFEARHYDGQIGRWMVQDPANQFASPYVGMGNDWVSGVDPDGRFAWFAPIIAGALIGGVSKGIKSSNEEGGNFLDGFWKGALVGGVGGAFSLIGGGPLLGDILLGIGQGLATNGLNNILEGESFFKNAGITAGISAAFVLANSDQVKNLIKGGGFRSNDQVLSRFVGNEDFEGALEYFNFNAKFDANGKASDGSAYRGYYSTKDKSITLSKYAFFQSDGARPSFDLLNSIYQKELWHQTRDLSGKLFYDLGDNYFSKFKYPLAAEDAMGHVFQQRNYGAWRSVHPENFYKGWLNFMPLSSNYARQYFHKYIHPAFFKQDFKHFLWSMPRRFNHIYPFNP
jgi:RHS repeat-associated protein